MLVIHFLDYAVSGIIYLILFYLTLITQYNIILY